MCDSAEIMPHTHTHTCSLELRTHTRTKEAYPPSSLTKLSLTIQNQIDNIVLTLYDNGRDDDVMTNYSDEIMLETHYCLSFQWHIREVEREWAALEGKREFTAYMKSVYDDITNIKNILENRMIIRAESQTQ